MFCPPFQVATKLLPPAIIVWGTADVSGGTEYDPNGLYTRDTYLADNECTNPPATTPGPHAPCVIYTGCTPMVQWCAIDGMPHDLWRNPPYPGDGAAAALATFFGSLP
jgi:hypothetical protein